MYMYVHTHTCTCKLIITKLPLGDMVMGLTQEGGN